MDSRNRQKIIIDTDCGVDDALALLLALSSKDVADIIAITCCFGNTSLDNVCTNVMRVLTLCGEKSIPIHRGSSGPLIKHESTYATVHGSDGLGGYANQYPTGDLKESDIPAAVALIDLAKKYPNEITLIAIGPLTNLAIAHRIDPEFTKKLKSISIMGGNYKGIGNVTEVAEFNFYCDPESANIILSEVSCPVKLVPWETTMDYGIPWNYYEELTAIKTKKGNLFKLATKCQLESDGGYIDCDFIATAATLYPECIKSSEMHHLRVEEKGTYARGLVIALRSNNLQQTVTEIITELHQDFLFKLRKKML